MSLQVDADVHGSSQGLAVDDGDVVGADGADAVEPGSGRQQCSVAGGASGGSNHTDASQVGGGRRCPPQEKWTH